MTAHSTAALAEKAPVITLWGAPPPCGTRQCRCSRVLRTARGSWGKLSGGNRLISFSNSGPVGICVGAVSRAVSATVALAESGRVTAVDDAVLDAATPAVGVAGASRGC